MKKELLHKFFEAKTTLKEDVEVKSWLNASEENKKIFFQERMVYDATLLNASKKLNNKTKSYSIEPWKISTVAAVTLLLIISGFYFLNPNGNTEQYNTIIAPPGQRINLILADNSNVWINANSTFRYPERFSKKNRRVYLDGEAHFDVQSNKKRPFIVETEYGSVQATGTSFNVEAYSKHGSFETSLFEGSVEVSINNLETVSLHPNEKSTLDDNQLHVSRITDTDEYLWKRGLIAFNNSELSEILSSLEKYFGIEIKIDTSKLPQNTYTGKFRQSDGVDYALRVLQRSIRFKYERDDNSGIIYIK